AALLRRRSRLRAFADLMAAAHRPGPGWTGWLRPDTDVCRCEEVPVAAIREAVEDLGAGDPRTVKLLTRAGMGWCQGRMCGPAVACLAGPGEPGPDRRPLGCPVPLSQLAAGPNPEA
ncbi:(2Fe-2S)-binding protein, partial [Kitasatospora sp. MY 5-36]